MSKCAFFQGAYVPLADAKLSIMTHCFMYGTGCFEGIRGYWSEEEQEIFLFRLPEHFERLMNSCKILRMQPQYTVDEMCRIAVEVVTRNDYREDVYLRPIYYKSSPEIGPWLTGMDDDFLLFSVPFGAYLDVSKGLKVRVSSWTHLDDNAIPMRAKINGAYVNAALAKTEAIDDGYDEAIFLSRDGHVSEGTAENLFLVRHGRLVTTPLTADILEGITRDTILQLAREELQLEVEERPVDRTELYVADEAFFVGTGAQVSPIAEIDHRQVGAGRMGPITRHIQQLYFDVVTGRVARYRHWCTPVYDSHRAAATGT